MTAAQKALRSASARVIIFVCLRTESRSPQRTGRTEAIQTPRGVCIPTSTAAVNYFAAENGVTRRSRRFSAFIGRLRDGRRGNNGNIHITYEVEDDLRLLSALAARLVRCVNDDLLDI